MMTSGQIESLIAHMKTLETDEQKATITDFILKLPAEDKNSLAQPLVSLTRGFEEEKLKNFSEEDVVDATC